MPAVEDSPMTTLQESVSDRVRACRFRADVALLERITGDQQLHAAIQDPRALEHRRTARGQLLASAVRVDERIVPGLARTFAEIAERAGIDVPFEAYVHQDAEINAYVGMGAGHLLISLTSGAVELLDENELEFVIGHELGHALFGHLDYVPGFALEHGNIPTRDAMLVTAWQRACEISADRAGLLCCGDLDVASTAIFKTLSGLRTPVRIDAHTFADQWEQLQQELVQRGDREHWKFSHPFPPMRLQALIAFAGAGGLEARPADCGERQEADRTVQSLLAFMDPLAREEGEISDPTLAEFMLWGGLYLAIGEGAAAVEDLAPLDRLVSNARLTQAFAALPSRARCLDELENALGCRDRRLRSLEVYRIVECLTGTAAQGGVLSASARESMIHVAGKLGLKAEAGTAIIDRVLKGTNGEDQ